MGFRTPSRVRIPPSPFRSPLRPYGVLRSGALLPIRTGMPVSFSIADSSDGPRKVVIWVTGDLGADTGRAVSARLAQAERHAQSDVILDLTSVGFIDSVAMSSIVTGARGMSEVQKLRVISPPDRIAR